MTSGPHPICVGCTRFHARDFARLTCDAFPDGIPPAIAENRTDHRWPVKGDRGLRFVPQTPEDAAYAVETFGPAPQEERR